MNDGSQFFIIPRLGAFAGSGDPVKPSASDETAAVAIENDLSWDLFVERILVKHEKIKGKGYSVSAGECLQLNNRMLK